MAAFILSSSSADASRFSLFVHGKKIIKLADLAYDIHKIGRSSAYISRSFRSKNICKNKFLEDRNTRFWGNDALLAKNILTYISIKSPNRGRIE